MTGESGRGASGGPAGTGGDRGDLLFVGVAALIAVAVTLFNVLNVIDERAEVGRPIPVWEPAVWEASSALVLLALLPAILWVTRRSWPLSPPWPRRLVVHLATALAVSLVHVLAMGAIRGLVYPLAGQSYDPWGPLANWPYELRQDLPVYVVLVGAYVGWRSLRTPLAAASPGPDAAGPEALEVRDGARRHFVNLAEVDWIEAAGNYVELHRASGPVLHRSSLADLERQLQGAGFVRIHRSRLVRRGAVSQVESRPSGDFMVRLAGGVELAGSRRFRRPLLEP
ncbi:MAG: LytTR family DNA-binding domain-containing protein [Pseudomonadota bacterium]